MKCEIYLGQALSGGNSPTEPGPRKNRSQSVNLRHLLILSAVLAIVPSFLLPRLAAASPGNDSETTHAPIRVMELDANYAYLGLAKNAHTEYVVFDISHPEAPKIVDQAEVGQSVSAICPSAIGTFIATESAERDIYLRTQEPASLQKIITLPGEGKIVKMDQLGEFLVILSKAGNAVDHTFLLDIKDPAAPRIHLESQRSEARIAHKLRIPPQIAKIPPLKVARLWQQHPGTPTMPWWVWPPTQIRFACTASSPKRFASGTTMATACSIWPVSVIPTPSAILTFGPPAGAIGSPRRC